MTRKKGAILITIILLSVLARVGSALIMGNQVVELPGTSDQISYHNLALRVLGGHGFSFDQAWWPVTQAGAPTAHWSYIYTFYLVIVYALFGPYPLVARLIQAVIVGILQPYLAYLLANRLFLRFAPLAGWISAGLTAFYAYFLYYSAALMTEPYFFTAILGSLYLSILLVDRLSSQDASRPGVRGRSVMLFGVALGVVFGCAVLLRQLYLLYFPFLCLWVWWAARGSRLRAMKALALSSLVIVLMILPFTLYNHARFNRFVLLNTNAGYALYWANHPIYGTRFIPILPGDLYLKTLPIELKEFRLDEAALDQELFRRGVQFITDDPGRYALLSLSRIPVFFEFWPTSDAGVVSNVVRIASFGILWPFMLYGLILSAIELHRRRESLLRTLSSPVVLLYLFVLFYTLLHILIWALIRYRLPVDTVLLIFAGLAWADLANRLFGKRWEWAKPVPVA